MPERGLFVGLITLDLIYLTIDLPDRNQKVVALDYTVAAGGPATNAAVTFRYLGQAATLMGTLGQHPMSQLVLHDLQQQDVTLLDLDPNRSDPPPTSSILVTQSTGDRSVISINAVQSQASVDRLPANGLQDVKVVLIDGHQIAVGAAIAQQAKAQSIPVVLDGGSWKPGLEAVLPYVDYAICSANFYPPACSTPADVFRYLEAQHIPHIVRSQGHQPIEYWNQGTWGSLPVPSIEAVDTTGAGDVLHGAFCCYLLHTDFPTALAQAATLASRSCQFFGTRQWMEPVNSATRLDPNQLFS